MREPCCCFDVKLPHRHEFVYLLVFEGGIVKIGRSADPSTRIAQHTSVSSIRFETGYLFAVLDSLKAEANLLRHYRKFKLNDGEWFVIPKEVLDNLPIELVKKPKWVINGIGYWPYCARMPECALCGFLKSIDEHEPQMEQVGG